MKRWLAGGLLLLLAACGGGDDGRVTMNELVGTWTEGSDIQYTFRGDGTAELKNTLIESSPRHITYKLAPEGDKLLITGGDLPEGEVVVKVLDGGETLIYGSTELEKDQ